MRKTLSCMFTDLINATTLGKCKKGVNIINVARGGIIDEEALLNSIKIGHCGGAALDVFIQEPPKNPITLELIQHPKVIATPHLGKQLTIPRYFFYSSHHFPPSQSIIQLYKAQK